MAKIAQVSSKYIIHSTINIEGVVDRPDVIGAIFGQTEGLLGEDLELRELQKSGRIGRIEVNTETKAGKTNGEIIIPSSLDKAETAIIGAALEVIQRIGPCNATIRVQNIEDIRVSKRTLVIERAKELLKNLVDGVIPDSQEIADEVAYSVRVTEITTYGTEKLSAGPAIADSDEIIVVEGRADVLNLLKYGFKNAIAVGGTSIPKTILELCKQKTATVFVDGDRGGDLIIRELMGQTDVDFVTKAPDGKEVEELTKKEIHKALRAKIASEQVHLESSNTATPAHNLQRRDSRNNRTDDRRDNRNNRTDDRRDNRERTPRKESNNGGPNDKEKQEFNKMLEDLIGTRGAYLLDRNLSILGKIPVSELDATVKSLNNAVYAVVFDGEATQELYDVSDKSNVRYLVGMSAKKVKVAGKTKVLTPEDLQ
ncbi:DNA primase [Candidatus Woesearchaeota archaeon]|nr:DNA primase [Candidatus Woesearchaeota archaeon]